MFTVGNLERGAARRTGLKNGPTLGESRAVDSGQQQSSRLGVAENAGNRARSSHCRAFGIGWSSGHCPTAQRRSAGRIAVLALHPSRCLEPPSLRAWSYPCGQSRSLDAVVKQSGVRLPMVPDLWTPSEPASRRQWRRRARHSRLGRSKDAIPHRRVHRSHDGRAPLFRGAGAGSDQRPRGRPTRSYFCRARPEAATAVTDAATQKSKVWTISSRPLDIAV